VKLSIVTINLNNRPGLHNTIESVVSQNLADSFEYVVIDGQSNDGSVDLIRSYGSKINKVHIEKDSGIYNAMNKGIKLSCGDYILFLNSADILVEQNVISKILPHLDGPDLVVGQTKYGNKYKPEFTFSHTMGEVYNLNYLIKASLPHQSTFISRELLLDGYDETLSICADWKFFLEAICIKKCSVKAISDIVTQFDAKGISSDPKNYERIDEEKTEVLWDLFRYDFKEWRIDDTRKKTADYYESLAVMKIYFKLNSLFRKLRT
jgi:glycosyltransferase involved in cell wall biosynthesis